MTLADMTSSTGSQSAAPLRRAKGYPAHARGFSTGFSHERPTNTAGRPSAFHSSIL